MLSCDMASGTAWRNLSAAILPPGAGMGAPLKAMEWYIHGRAELMGRCTRGR